MEKASSMEVLDMSEGGEYDLKKGKFTPFGQRQCCRIHCGKRCQIATIVIGVLALLLLTGILMAMFGPGNADLKYHTAALKNPGGEGKNCHIIKLTECLAPASFSLATKLHANIKR